jgi:GAF domain-containing protein/CheY-like chemotaxis protein
MRGEPMWSDSWTEGSRSDADRGAEGLSLSPALSDVARAIAAGAAHLTGAASASVWLIDRSAGVLERRAVSDEALACDQSATVVPVGTGIVGWVARHRREVDIPDIRVDPRSGAHDTPCASSLTSALALPICDARDLLGVVALFHHEPLVLSASDRDRLDRLIADGAAAITTARLDAAEKRAERLATLSAVTHVIASERDGERVATAVARAAVTLLGATLAHVWAPDPGAGELWVRGNASADTDCDSVLSPGTVIAPEAGVAAHVFETGTAEYVEDIEAAPRRPTIAVSGAATIRSYAAVPLVTCARKVGVLSLLFVEPRRFAREDTEILRLLTQHAAVAIDNARRLEETEERRLGEKSLADLGRSVSQSLDPAEVGRRVVDGVLLLFRARAAGLFRRDPETEALVAVATAGDHGPTGEPMVYPAGTGMVGLAVRQRQAVVTADLLDDARLTLDEDMRARVECAPYRAVLAVPLLAGETVIGALAIGDVRGRVFDDEEIRLAQAFAGHAALAIQNAHLYEQVVRRGREAQELGRLARALTESLDAKAVAERVVDSVLALFGARSSGLHVARADGSLEAVAWGGAARQGLTAGQVLPRGHGAAGRAVAIGAPVRSLDVLDDPRISLPEAIRTHVEAIGDRSVLAVPLRSKGHIVGALVIADAVGRLYSQAEVALLQAFADEAATAVENARLYAETERRRREAEEVARVARTLTEELDVAALGERVVRGVLPLVHAQAAALRLLQPDGSLVEVAAHGRTSGRREPGHVARPGVGVAGRVIALGHAVQTRDAQSDPDIVLDQELRSRIVELGRHAALGVPVRLKSEILGVLLIFDDATRTFADAEIALLQTLADQTAVAVRNAQLLAELVARQGRLETLLEVSRQLSRLQPLDSLLDRIAEACARLLDTDSVTLRLVDGDELVVAKRWGTVAEPDIERARIGESPIGAVAASGEPLLITDVARDSRMQALYRGALEGAGYVAWLGVPVTAGDRVIGVLSVRRRSPDFPPDSIATATAFASQAAITLENSRLYGELEAALARLESSQERLVQSERLRALGEMAGGVAHDFNNLLAVVLGRAELLLQRVQEPAAVRGLQIIRDAAMQGAQTVRRIQQFTRLGQTRPVGPIDLASLLAEVVELTRPLWKGEAQERGADYDVRVEVERTAPVAGVADELREVFTNLLVNALEAMPGGGRLVLRVSVVGDDVIIDAEDTGSGMTEATRRRAFEPFFTTKGPQRAGLGLSVVWGIVTRHGGTITVVRTSENGTTLRIALPRISAPSAGPIERAPEVDDRRGSATVLVVDDEPEVRAVLAELLTCHGYSVIQAETGREALAVADSRHVDLLLTDLSMPEMSGWEVVAAYRERHPGGPVGLVTGWSHRLDSEQVQRYGVDLVIAKPFDTTEILKELARILASR